MSGANLRGFGILSQAFVDGTGPFFFLQKSNSALVPGSCSL